jgi:very-short-patch-repair endonuclease
MLTGRAGLQQLSRVTALWTPERESLLEDALDGDVRAVTDLQVERQYEVRDRRGVLLGRTDVAIPELRQAFEADGLLFHSTDAQIAADQQRDRRFMGAGWQTARFREGAFENRALVRRDVRAMVEARRTQLKVA